jgi:hypothetical protein
VALRLGAILFCCCLERFWPLFCGILVARYMFPVAAAVWSDELVVASAFLVLGCSALRREPLFVFQLRSVFPLCVHVFALFLHPKPTSFRHPALP